MRRPSAGLRQIAGIDVVGADLVGLRGQAALFQGGEDAAGERGLAAAALRGGDDEAGNFFRFAHDRSRPFAEALSLRPVLSL